MTEKRITLDSRLLLENTSTKTLIEAYFADFNYDSRLPELFELIEEEKLRKWLIEKIING
jgi:hypothetical protein